MPRFRFTKLVRDKIVDLQLDSGAKPKYRHLGKEEHRQELINKIIEEANELKTADNDQLAPEIADILQAIDDYCSVCTINRADVAAAKKSKLKNQGGFSKGIYIDYVDILDNDPWVAYYKQNSDRYPKIN